MQTSCFVGYLMESSFDIYKIMYSTKANEKYICYRFRKPETYLLVERFNDLSRERISMQSMSIILFPSFG